ncbi:MAG: hypothetical protein JSU74_03185 [Candidatus Zixiibacteriota bacterium]|nr:MAG: hypothetical protein JSU74_03185 [candidate division Zixibacteria bacterium]
MPKRLLVLCLLSLILAAGCSKRRTRQFIICDPPTAGFKAGEWTIAPPSVVAFKDVVNLDAIADTTMFWISLRASKPVSGDVPAGDDLIIDSVKVSFLPDGGEYWRIPTRAAPYSGAGEACLRKAFDFFGDQGIVIPAGVDRILVEFEAIATGSDREKQTHPVRIEMMRDEAALRVPLLQQ